MITVLGPYQQVARVQLANPNPWGVIGPLSPAVGRDGNLESGAAGEIERLSEGYVPRVVACKIARQFPYPLSNWREQGRSLCQAGVEILRVNTRIGFRRIMSRVWIKGTLLARPRNRQ